MDVNICVIGAGIIGLSTAVNVSELRVPGRKLNVSLIADQFSPQTTSDGAAGFWGPFFISENRRDKIKKMDRVTFDHVLRLANSGEGATCGCFLISGSLIHLENSDDSDKMEVPFWKDIVLNFNKFCSSDIRRYDHLLHDSKSAVYTFASTMTESVKYLPWLLNRFLKNGGIVKQRKIHRLDELASTYDIVVNCTGLGSYDLVPDAKVRPIKGQTLIVEAPWIKHFTGLINNKDKEIFYILPKERYVILGGTGEYDAWDTTPSKKDSKHIMEGCTKIEPSLKHAKVIGEWAGLRPGRTELRLEKDVISTKHGQLKVVHNYGHDGAGITLHWGCALEATALVKECVQEIPLGDPKSRL